MNIIKKFIAWVRVDPQQDELDARREHYELLGIQGRNAVAIMHSIGARWLPFTDCAYAWRIGGTDWATSTDPCVTPCTAMTTWPPNHQESAAIYTLGLLGYRWRAAFQEYQKVKEPENKSYVDAYYEMAELLQIEKGGFMPLNLSMPEMVKAHILSLVAVETEYLKLIDKNSRRK